MRAFSDHVFLRSAGKKGKKSKEKKLSLQDFLATTPSTGGTQLVHKVSSWAEECEDDDERPSRPEFIELPTAPRAARILDDETIPHTGPFSARVSNLPFDASEADIDEFFMEKDIQTKELRLARDDQTERLRGYGHIEFVSREDLINALMLPDAMVRNRRIRIELASDNDQREGRTVRKRFDNYTPRDANNDSTNWRDRKESNFEPVERENRRGGDRGGDRGYQSRPSFQNRHDNNNNDSNEDGGNWRLGDRPANESPQPERRRNNFGGDRDRRGGRDGGGRDGGGRDGGGRDRGYERRENEDRPDEERPVLNLAPRTKPLPVLTFPKEEELERPARKVSSINGDAENHNDSGLAEDDEKEAAPPAPKPKPVPAADIFGQAKPVDTAAREREIEEKLEKEREAKFIAEKEHREREREEVEKADDEPRRDVIVIKTEKARQQEEAVNWRKHDEPENGSDDNIRNRDNGKRFVDGDRRRSEIKY